MKTAQDIRSILDSAMPGIRQRYPVGDAILFGSCARGDQNDASDLDLALRFTGRITYRQWMALQWEIEELVGRKVDLSDLDGLHPIIRSRAESEGIAL